MSSTTTTLFTSQFTTPHFNSFIDLNSDCRADLLITSVSSTGAAQLEYWYTALTKTSENRYCLQYFETLSVTLLSLNFQDVNFDGLIDMVAIASSPENPSVQYIVINFNNYTPPGEKSMCQSNSDVVYNYPYQSIELTNSTVL
jgi:integrin alpha FG-GAP repeat containing protein 1